MEINPVKFVETTTLKNPAYWIGTDIPKVLNARVGEDYLTADLIPFTPIPKSLDLQQRGLREFLK